MVEVVGKLSGMLLDGDNLTIVRLKSNGERKSKLTIRTSAIVSIDYKPAGDLAPGHIDVRTSTTQTGLPFDRPSCAQFTQMEEAGFARIARALGVPGIDPEKIEAAIAERAASRKRKEESAKKRWKIVGISVAGLFVVAVVFDLAHRAIDPEGYAAAKAEREAERALPPEAVSAPATNTATAAEELAEREAGLHCLSAWDGANRDLVRQVKASMREPDSFEHIDTRIYGNDDGEHGLWMKFRARNGFGGMNIEKVYARIDHESCTALRFGDGPGI